MILVCANLCEAKTYVFGRGKVPPVTLVRAVSICEKVASNSAIKIFNPETARLMGDEKPDSGAWHFEQVEKDGRFFTISVRFPENICAISENGNLIEVFNFDGTKMPVKKEK